MKLALYETDMLSWNFNMLDHESNSPQEDTPLNPDMLF